VAWQEGMRTFIGIISLLLLAAAPAKDFKLKQQGKIYSYEYGWPKEAVAIPALNRKLSTEMIRNRRGPKACIFRRLDTKARGRGRR
jgi:hypothetical protein